MPFWRAQKQCPSGALQRLVRGSGALTLWLSLAVLASTVVQAADVPEVRLYRYIDSRGVTVIDRLGVPAEYVAKGYEVLNARGRVVQVIPPAPLPNRFVRPKPPGFRPRPTRNFSACTAASKKWTG